MRHLILALLLLMPGVAAAADNSSELQNLYSALNMLNQQQQAIYQQFQMVQELRQAPYPVYGAAMAQQFMGPPANYDDIVAAQKSAIRRDEDLSQQAEQLLDQYNEVEQLKKPLQQRIYQLTQPK
jgi:hypothetical protein